MIPATMQRFNSQNRLCEALLLLIEACSPKNLAIYSYECQHSTSIRQGSWLCIVAILHKFYIRRYCILHKQDKVKIETENVKYVM